MATTKFSRFRRLQMLGPSLPAILIGGLILILVGVNGLSGRKAKGELGSTRQAGQVRFSVGYEWGLQTWIAIVGVAFALLSFGFSEAYIHLFDTWSSRQAEHGNGLDYARYLNSQPRAPVIYGFRGFPAFLTLRYFLIAMGIISSIGYKFAIVSPDAWIKENLEPDKITFSGTQLSAVRSESEPWIIDLPFLDGNRAFLHRSQFPKGDNFPINTLPPLGIAMVGHASCYRANYKRGGLFYPADVGTLFTRELALMANGSVEAGDFYMTEDPGNWHRMESTSTDWFDPPSKAIVEYRVVDAGELEIQWARARNHSSDTWREPVSQRYRYSMNLATVSVMRQVRDQNCKKLSGVAQDHFEVRAYSNDTFKNAILAAIPWPRDDTVEERLDISTRMPEYSVWLEALVKTPDASLLSGVSAIIRAVMASTKTRLTIPKLKAGDLPFGEEKASVLAQSYSDMEYPFYVGWRAEKNTGCHFSAAIVFIIIGCFAIMVGVYRIWLGPPSLTSWMGQHVYLARTEAIVLSDKAIGLASGYTVADSDLGRLRLSAGKGEESDAMLTTKVSSEGHHSDSEGAKEKNQDGGQDEMHGTAIQVDDIGTR